MLKCKEATLMMHWEEGIHEDHIGARLDTSSWHLPFDRSARQPVLIAALQRYQNLTELGAASCSKMDAKDTALNRTAAKYQGYHPFVKACQLVTKTDEALRSSQGGVIAPQAEVFESERFMLQDGLAMPEVPRIQGPSSESGSRDKLLPGPSNTTAQDGAGLFKGLIRRL